MPNEMYAERLKNNVHNRESENNPIFFDEDYFFDSLDCNLNDNVDFYYDAVSSFVAKPTQEVGCGPITNMISRMVSRVAIRITTQLLERYVGVSQALDIYNNKQLSSFAKVEQLAGLLGRYSNNFPKEYYNIVHNCINLLNLIASMQSLRSSFTEISIISQLNHILTDLDCVINNPLLGTVLLTENVEKLSVSIRSAQHQLNQIQMLSSLPATTDIGEWLTILAQMPALDNYIPSMLKTLLPLAATVADRVGGLDYSVTDYPAEGTVAERITWLMKILDNDALLDRMLPLLSQQSDDLRDGILLFRHLRSLPASATFSQQVVWLSQLTALPETQRVMNNLGLQSMMEQFNRLSTSNPTLTMLVNMMLQLSDSRESYWQKAGNVISLMFTGQNMRSAIRMALSQTQYGAPMVVSWDIYQDLPEGANWGATLVTFTERLIRKYRSLLPTWISNSIDVAIGLSSVRSKEELLAWAVEGIRQYPEYEWYYQRYIGLCLMWQCRQALSQSDPLLQESDLRTLADQLKGNAVLFGFSSISPILDILPLLPAIIGVQKELRRQPSVDSVVGWVSALSDILAESSSPALQQLKGQLEIITERWLSDFVLSSLDGLPQLNDPFRFPSADAAVIPDSYLRLQQREAERLGQVFFGETANDETEMVRDELESEEKLDDFDRWVISDTPEIEAFLQPEKIPTSYCNIAGGIGLAMWWSATLYMAYKAQRVVLPPPNTEDEWTEMDRLSPQCQNNGQSNNTVENVETQLIIQNEQSTLHATPSHTQKSASERLMRYRTPLIMSVIGIFVSSLYVYLNLGSGNEDNVNDVTQDEVRKIIDFVLKENLSGSRNRVKRSEPTKTKHKINDISNEFNSQKLNLVVYFLWEESEGEQPAESTLSPVGEGIEIGTRTIKGVSVDEEYLMINGVYWEFTRKDDNATEGYISNNNGDKIEIALGERERKGKGKVWHMTDPRMLDLSAVSSLFFYSLYPSSFRNLLKREIKKAFSIYHRMEYNALLHNIYYILTVLFVKNYENDSSDASKELNADLMVNIFLAKHEVLQAIERLNEGAWLASDGIKAVLNNFELHPNELLLSSYKTALSTPYIDETVYNEAFMLDSLGQRDEFFIVREEIQSAIDESNEKIERHTESIKFIEKEISDLNKNKKENEIDKLKSIVSDEREKIKMKSTELSEYNNSIIKKELQLNSAKNGIELINDLVSSTDVKLGQLEEVKRKQRKIQFKEDSILLKLALKEIDIRNKERTEYSDDDLLALQAIYFAKHHLSVLIVLQREHYSIVNDVYDKKEALPKSNDYMNIVNAKVHAVKLFLNKDDGNSHGYYSREGYLSKYNEILAQEGDGGRYLMQAAAIIFKRIISPDISKDDLYNASRKEIMRDFYNENVIFKNSLFYLNENEPVDYIKFSEFRESTEFYWQIDFTNQFNDYIDKGSSQYDARLYTTYALSSELLSESQLISAPKKVYEYALAYVNPNGAKSTLLPGRIGVFQLENDDWFVVSGIAGGLDTVLIEKNVMESDIILRIISERKLGYNNYDEINKRRLPDAVFPKNERWDSNNTLMDANLVNGFLKKIWGDYLPDIINKANGRGLRLVWKDDKNFTIPTDKPLKESIAILLNSSIDDVAKSCKASMYHPSDWQLLGERFIPLYKTIYHSNTDRHYEIDVGEILMDLIAIALIILPTGIKLFKLASKQITQVSQFVAKQKSLGLRGKKLIISVLKELPAIGLDIVTASTKILSNAALEIIEPFPVSNLLKSINKSKFYLMSKENLSNLIDDINPSSNAVRRLKPEWRQQNISLDYIESDHGLYKVKSKNAQSMQDYDYYIKQDDDVYQVRFDAADHTWRVINPAHPGKFSYAVPVRLKENNVWEVHSDVGLKGGGKIELNNWMKEHIKEYASIPKENAKAIRRYTQGTFKVYNEKLRIGDKMSGRIKTSFDQVIASMHALPDYSGEVYRGSSMNRSVFKDLKVGDVIFDPAFFSTSVDKNAALFFLEKSSSDKIRYLMTIDVKRGKSLMDKELSVYASKECEVLLLPSTPIQITKIEYKGPDAYIYGKEMDAMGQSARNIFNGKMDVINEVGTASLRLEWKVDDVSLFDKKMGSEVISGIDYNKVYRLPDDKYYIEQDGNTYKVKWDGDNHTWRVENPATPGSQMYATPIKLNHEGRWVTHSNVNLRGGGLQYKAKSINRVQGMSESHAKEIRSLVWAAKNKAVTSLDKVIKRVESKKLDDVQNVNLAFNIFIGAPSEGNKYLNLKNKYVVQIKKQRNFLREFKASEEMNYQGGYKEGRPGILFETQYANGLDNGGHTPATITAFADSIVDANYRLGYTQDKFENFIATALTHESYHVITKDSPDLHYPTIQGEHLDISGLVKITDPLLREVPFDSIIKNEDLMKEAFSYGWGKERLSEILSGPAPRDAKLKGIINDRLTISGEEVWKNPDNTSYMSTLISYLDTDKRLFDNFVERYKNWKADPSKPLLWDFSADSSNNKMSFENTDTGKISHADITPLISRGLATGAVTDNINLKFEYLRNDKVLSMAQSESFRMDEMTAAEGKLKGVLNTWKGSHITSKATDGTIPGLWGNKFTLSDNVSFIHVVNGHSGTVAIKVPLSEIKEGMPVIVSAGRLSGCTMVYAVDDNYFYAYHTGQKGGDSNWLTSSNGVASLYASHLKLKNKLLPNEISDVSMTNNVLVDIFSMYDKSVITYLGKDISVSKNTRISKKSANVDTFDYNESNASNLGVKHQPTFSTSADIGLSYALLAKDRGKVNVKVSSESLSFEIGSDIKFDKISGREVVLK